MKRRNFLGFLGGAVAAGPKLAGDLGTQARLGADAGGVMQAATAATNAPGDWRPIRIAQLKDWLSGKGTDDAQQRRRQRLYQAEQLERFRLDTLRSVSPSHRVQMFINGNLDRSERIQRMHWEQELEELLKF